MDIYKIISNFDRKKWSAYVKIHPKGNIYHTPQIYEVYQKTMKIKPIFIGVIKEGKLVGLALGEISNEYFNFFGITRRTIFYSEPIYNNDSKILDLILENIKKQSLGIFIQIRLSEKLVNDEINIYKKNGFILDNHLDAKIKLISEELIWKNISKDKKKGIKRATNRFDLQIRENSSINGIEMFYPILAKLYKKKRHHLRKKDYFVNLLNFSDGYLKLFFAYYKNEPIATQVIYIYKKKITALYTATYEEHKNKYAGDLLIWEVIKFGLENDFVEFDFGGGGNPDNSYGPRDYKKRFGTVFENIGRFVFKKSILYNTALKIYHFLLKK